MGRCYLHRCRRCHFIEWQYLMKLMHTGMIIAVLGGAFGQLLMKSGMQSLPLGNLSSTMNSLLHSPISALLIIAGIVSYVVSMIVWVHTLKDNKLSKAYPILSLGYVVVYFFATLWPGLQETITFQKSLGIALIIFGVWLAHSATSAEES